MTERASKTKRLEFIIWLYDELAKLNEGDEEEAAALVALIDVEERIVGTVPPPPAMGKLLEDIHLNPWKKPEA